MQIKRNIEQLFPTPVGVARFNKTEFDFKKYSNLIFKTLTSKDLDNLAIVGVCPTPDDLHIRAEFQDLVSLIVNEAETFFREELGLDTATLALECMWANVQIDGCRHHAHVHPNSFYSGVIYIDVPDDDTLDPGAIFFIDPRPAKQMSHADYKKNNSLSIRSYGFKPQTGMMLLFPSWLEHGTDVCKIGAGKYRISLSFNYSLLKCSDYTMKLNLQKHAS